MKKTLIRCAAFAGATLITSAAWTQIAQITDAPPMEGRLAVKMFAEGMAGGRTITGAPYSADESTQTTQTLADGTRIVNSSTSKVYRDAQGRTRVEHNRNNIGSMPAEGPPTVMINDPVANVHYMLQPENRTAIKMGVPQEPSAMEREARAKADLAKAAAEHAAIATAGQVMINTSGVVTASGGNVAYSVVRGPMAQAERSAKTEDLGTQTMEGVQVKGTRHTMTIPANTIGNDRDISIVDETWYSPDLKKNIMTRHSDPRMGETVYSVTNVNRNNPDASLFQVPADYQTTEQPNKLMFRDLQLTPKQ